jgi:hypothetical protein
VVNILMEDLHEVGGNLLCNEIFIKRRITGDCLTATGKD